MKNLRWIYPVLLMLVTFSACDRDDQYFYEDDNYDEPISDNNRFPDNYCN